MDGSYESFGKAQESQKIEYGSQKVEVKSEKAV
jgi:hypothetical protein